MFIYNTSSWHINCTSKSLNRCVAEFFFLSKNANSKMLLLLYPTSHSLPILQFKYTRRASLTVNINKTKCFTVDVNVYFIVLAFILSTLKGHTSYKEMKSLQEHRRKKKKATLSLKDFFRTFFHLLVFYPAFFSSIVTVLMWINPFLHILSIAHLSLFPSLSETIVHSGLLVLAWIELILFIVAAMRGLDLC